MKPFLAKGALLSCLLGFLACANEGEHRAIAKTEAVYGNGKMVFTIQAFASDPEKHLYVLDDKDRNIKVFDEKGEFIRTIGEKGQGPGEMMVPRSLELNNRNQLIIQDLGNRKIIVFSTNGDLVKELSTARLPRLGSIRYVTEGAFVGEISHYSEGSRISELLALDEDMEKKAVIARLENKVENDRIEIFPHMFRYAVISEREVLWGDWYDDHLTMSSIDGKVERTLMLNHKRMKVTEEDKERAIKRRFGDERPKEELVFPDFFPYYSNFFVDANNVYLLSFERGATSGHSYYRVNMKDNHTSKIFFDPDPVEFHDNNYYSLSEDEQGNQLIVRMSYVLSGSRNNIAN